MRFSDLKLFVLFVPAFFLKQKQRILHALEHMIICVFSKFCVICGWLLKLGDFCAFNSFRVFSG